MMAMTTSSSISVNAERRRGHGRSLSGWMHAGTGPRRVGGRAGARPGPHGSWIGAPIRSGQRRRGPQAGRGGWKMSEGVGVAGPGWTGSARVALAVGGGTRSAVTNPSGAGRSIVLGAGTGAAWEGAFEQPGPWQVGTWTGRPAPSATTVT